ncbi:unnamed protein product [Orchesella dallaii]|uniref:Uncharacterized protein n=1 Tax=Orchesella dallaii TaxID=48710 RepID=A0ABP1RQ43_9HEXA
MITEISTYSFKNCPVTKCDHYSQNNRFKKRKRSTCSTELRKDRCCFSNFQRDTIMIHIPNSLLRKNTQTRVYMNVFPRILNLPEVNSCNYYDVYILIYILQHTTNDISDYASAFDNTVLGCSLKLAFTSGI